VALTVGQRSAAAPISTTNAYSGGYHHREHGNRGWQVIIPDGQPYWIPPPRIDPARTPIRNTAHDGPVTLALEPA
jgi:hypothetical protein